MKRFYCSKCAREGRDPVHKEATAKVVLSASLYINWRGEVCSDWEGELPLGEMVADSLRCEECGGEATVIDMPCQHDWAAVEHGAGAWEGFARRKCRICGTEQVARVAAGWPEQEQAKGEANGNSKRGIWTRVRDAIMRGA